MGLEQLAAHHAVSEDVNRRAVRTLAVHLVRVRVRVGVGVGVRVRGEGWGEG